MACWQWKQISSVRRGFRLNRCRATRTSCSAFRSHCPVSLFIQHFAARHDVLEEAITPAKPCLERLGRADDQVEGEAAVIDRLVDAHRLLDLVPGLHDHQQIDIAIGRRHAPGIGAEQKDPIRAKAIGNLPGISPDRCHRHEIRVIKPSTWIFPPRNRFGIHGSILEHPRRGANAKLPGAPWAKAANPIRSRVCLPRRFC